MSNDIIGKRFERLVVLKQEGQYKNSNKLYICLCDCGGQCQTTLPHLKRGEVRSCGCLAKENISKIGKLQKKNLLGKKFGRLTVVAEDEHTKYGVKWLCKCDCGNESVVLGVNLRKKNGTLSCGCLARERTIIRNKKKRSSNPWAVEMYHYESGAVQRDIVFELTEDEFKELILSNCYYCGGEPQTNCQSAELKEKKILRNGIDRLDSGLGYYKENCVSCCWSCNKDKLDKPYKQFLQDIKRRYDHLHSVGLI